MVMLTQLTFGKDYVLGSLLKNLVQIENMRQEKQSFPKLYQMFKKHQSVKVPWFWLYGQLSIPSAETQRTQYFPFPLHMTF